MIAAETIGRLNFCSHSGPFGLLVSAFICVPSSVLVEGVCVFGIVEVAGGIGVVLPGVIVPFVVFVHGLPFWPVACAPGLFEFTGFAFVFAGVLGETGGALVFGVVELTDVLVFVLAPVVPLPGAVFVTVLFVQFAGALAAGGLAFVVVWAKAGADSPAIRPAALAKPRILAPTVMRRFSPREAINKKCLRWSYPSGTRIMKSESQPGRASLVPGRASVVQYLSVPRTRLCRSSGRPAATVGAPYVTT